MVDYLGPYETDFYRLGVKPARKPARQPTPAEATVLLDAMIRRTAAEKQTDYNGALMSLQSEAPELVNYFQTMRRIRK
jgi:hypothetical protein